MKTDYSKLRTKIFGIVEGLSLSDSKYSRLRRLMSLAETFHCNQRKDGSEEFSHQLEMLGLALTFHQSLSKPLDVYMAVIAHDMIEDYPESLEVLQADFPEVIQYSKTLAKEVDKRNTVEPEYFGYFSELGQCEVCSVVKLIDRVHNLSTAPGVFTESKILQYCDEVDEYFFDMIRAAKIQFDQRPVYEALKFMLNTQIHTIRSLLAAKDV